MVLTPALSVLLLALGAGAEEVAVVSAPGPEFSAAAAAAAGCLPEGSAAAVTLPTDSRGAADALDRLRRDRPRVIAAVGARAAGAVDRAFPNTPLVYLMVVSPQRLHLNSRERAYGVAWLPTSAALTRTLRLLLGPTGRLGTISSLPRGGVARLERTFRENGLELAVAPIADADDLPDALRALHDRQVALLWLGVDPVTADPGTYGFVQNAALQLKLPLVTPFDPGPDGNALAGVRVSPAESGRAACRILVRILRDEEPPAVTHLDSVELSLDVSIADALGYKVPDEARKAAVRVYGAPPR